MVAPFLYKKWDPEAAFTRKQSIMSGGCQCIIIQMLKSPKFLSCQDLSLSLCSVGCQGACYVVRLASNKAEAFIHFYLLYLLYMVIGIRIGCFKVSGHKSQNEKRGHHRRDVVSAHVHREATDEPACTLTHGHCPACMAASCFPSSQLSRVHSPTYHSTCLSSQPL